MPVVFACVVPHSGNMLLPPEGSTPIPQTRAAMQEMRGLLEASRPDCIALITPHGEGVHGAYTLGGVQQYAGSLGEITVKAEICEDLVNAWGNFAHEHGVPCVSIIGRTPDVLFPLDWGAVIPLALLAPSPHTPPVAIACPSTAISRPHLVAWGKALAQAADSIGQRVALIVSADQGHGHAADGPYGLDAASAEYDMAMTEAIHDNDLPRLLHWEDNWIEAAKVDSYWQTLALIGVQRHVPLKPHVLSYEIDHYFGLLCAAFTLETG